MLIQLYQNNLNSIPEELEVEIYNGYFGGTTSDPKLSWFNTATLLSIKYTSDLTSLETVTNGLYSNNTANGATPDNISIKISGFFRAKQTGVCRFFTRTDDASFLYINDTLVVNNGNTHAPQNAFGNINTVAGTYYKIDIYYGETVEGQWFSAGYLEQNSTSTNINQFITNATGLTTYYEINPTGQVPLTTNIFPLTILDGSLQGLFKVSPLALYFNRSNFVGGKGDLFYMASDELFNNFNGTYKNYIQLHEKPVANDNERKQFSQFSSDMSFECELNGKIEIRFKRGVNEPVTWAYAMVILDVERIPTKNI